jgi:hypothetical protein
MAIKTFTTGEVLTASDTNTYLANSGLVFVGSTAFNGVTNNFTSVFSATYDHYQILLTGLNNASVTTRGVVMKLLSGSTPTSDSTYTTNSIYQFSSTTLAASGTTTSTSFDLTQLSSNTGGSGSIRLEMFNPFNAVNTFITLQQETYQSNISSFIFRTAAGIHNTQTSYNGFQLLGTTDNFSGTATVYGYRKA